MIDLSEAERQAIRKLGKTPPDKAIPADVIADLLMKGLILINLDKKPELTDEGKAVFRGLNP